MKKRFKLIPFLISLLLVVGITFAICWYSFYGYKLNRIKFYDDYFHKSDYKDVETTALIENAVKFQFLGYKKDSSSIKFYTKDDSKIDFTDKKNGTINVPNYFDIDIYMLDTSSDANGDASYAYYFYFYNINYKTLKIDYTSLQANQGEPVDTPFSVITVKGKGSPSEDELNDPNVKLYGDALIDDTIKKLNSGTSNNIKTNEGAALSATAYSENNNQHNYLVYDNGSSITKFDTPVWRVSPRLDIDSKTPFVKGTYEDGEATFAICINVDGSYTEIIRGTFDNLNDLDKVDYKLGANGDVLNNKALKKEYRSFIWPRVLVHGIIAFVISLIIAILFYMIWQDNKEVIEKETKSSKFNGSIQKKSKNNKKKK